MQLFNIPYWELENNMTDADFVQLLVVLEEKPKKKGQGRKLSDFAK